MCGKKNSLGEMILAKRAEQKSGQQTATPDPVRPIPASVLQRGPVQGGLFSGILTKMYGRSLFGG